MLYCIIWCYQEDRCFLGVEAQTQRQVDSLLSICKPLAQMDIKGAEAKLLDFKQQYFGFPADCLPLVLIRSISGSGALAVLNDILTTNHPDSLTGRIASVMMGSTETTFYTIAVYFSAAKLKCGAKTIIPAITADIFGFVFAVVFVRLLF